MRTLSSCLAAFLLAALCAAPLHAQTTADGDAPPVRANGYGNAVAVDDGTAFVGEPNNKYNPGAVYHYHQEGGEWTRGGKLTAEGAEPNDGFGAALAARGGRLLVGATSDGGAVFLFEETGSGYEQIAELMSEGGEDEGFGSGGVATGSDWIAVGAPGASDDGMAGAGAVYVFRNTSGNNWTQAARLTGSEADSSSTFGAALDYRDGNLLVGAPGAGPQDAEGPVGTAYLFARQNGTWTEVGATQGPASDCSGDCAPTGFGQSVSLHDGRAFVGAPLAGGNTGMVGVYALSGDGGWQPAGQLHPFDGGQRHFFGMGIAHPSGETWVSALGAKQLSGRIYSFTESGEEDGAWTSSNEVVTGENEQDLLGRSLAAEGDVAAVGAQGNSEAMILTPSGSDMSNWVAQATFEGDPGGLPAITGSAMDCEDGQAAGRYSCKDVKLLSFLPIKKLGGEEGVNLNDIWGWKDPQTGTPYALVGRTNGMAFVDISDPQNPVYVGELPLTPGDTQPNSWRDAKVYKDHMYVVADNAGDHGMQVFDLTRLREHEPGDEPITYEAGTVYNKVNSAHNGAINKETGYAYIVGAGAGPGVQSCGGGLHMVNIQEPMNPTFAGCFADERTGRRGTGYSHDAQCTVYDGPDGEFQGREICFGANETALSIADVTDKDNPRALAVAEYPNSAYTHQGWLTEDQRYFYLNDELDELSNENVDSTRTIVFDVTDLDNPRLVKTYTYGPKSSDHNLYIKGDRMYMSNYASGLRVHDVSDPENPEEIAYFDTSPAGNDDPPGFTGTWSNYPYFENGVVAVSSIGEGLFLLKPAPEQREGV
jgi:choice-of-anchor B domain-containing protein